jgi:hypothetical protein
MDTKTKTYTMADLDAAFRHVDTIVDALAADPASDKIYVKTDLACRLVVATPYGSYTTLTTHDPASTHPAAKTAPIRTTGKSKERLWNLADLCKARADATHAWAAKLAADLADSKAQALLDAKAHAFEDAIAALKAAGVTITADIEKAVKTKLGLA